MKKFIVLAILIIGQSVLHAQNLNDTSKVQKTGWLVYWHDQVIWFESKLKKSVKEKDFFINQASYPNGLVVNFLPLAKYYRAIAKCYSIKALSRYDTVSKKADYTLSDNVCVLPIKVTYMELTRPVSELLQPMGVSFKKDSNEVTMTYNFETNYDIAQVELFRKKDKKKIRRIKNYDIYPPH